MEFMGGWTPQPGERRRSRQLRLRRMQGETNLIPAGNSPPVPGPSPDPPPTPEPTGPTSPIVGPRGPGTASTQPCARSRTMLTEEPPHSDRGMPEARGDSEPNAPAPQPDRPPRPPLAAGLPTGIPSAAGHPPPIPAPNQPPDHNGSSPPQTGRPSKQAGNGEGGQPGSWWRGRSLSFQNTTPIKASGQQSDSRQKVATHDNRKWTSMKSPHEIPVRPHNLC